VHVTSRAANQCPWTFLEATNPLGC
jgi:hypothetical protein